MRFLVAAIFCLASMSCKNRTSEATVQSSKGYALPRTQTAQYQNVQLIARNEDSFIKRMELIENAKQNLDLAYYIYEDDVTGSKISLALLEAAERGVNVRLILDYANTPNIMPTLLLLRRAGVDVRLYGGPSLKEKALLEKLNIKHYLSELRKLSPAVGDIMWTYLHLAPRMHNKITLADDKCFIMGGRNISDEYQVSYTDEIIKGNKEKNLPTRRFPFQDVDLAACETQGLQKKIFDSLWDSELNITLGQTIMVRPVSTTPILRSVLETKSKESGRVLAGKITEAASLGAQKGRLFDNRKELKFETHDITDMYTYLLDSALPGEEVNIVNAYFLLDTSYNLPILPISKDEAQLIRLYQTLRHAGLRGVKVNLYTNSAETTDLWYKNFIMCENNKDLMSANVKIWDFKKGKGSLHTKAAMFSDKYLVVGSYNMDPRSHFLDTNNAILVEGNKNIKSDFDKNVIGNLQENWKLFDTKTACPSTYNLAGREFKLSNFLYYKKFL